MKRIIVKLVVVLTVLTFVPIESALATPITDPTDPVLIGAIIVDFESQTKGSYVSLTIGGVTFTANDRHLMIDDTYSGTYGSVGKYLDSGTYSDMGFFSLTITFSNPTNAFGFQWDMAEPEAIWNLRAYDSSDNLMDTYLLPNTNGSATGAFVGISANNISYATLINTSPDDLQAGNGIGYDWISIDNFTYQPIPEPATMVLLGGGLLAIVLKKRK